MENNNIELHFVLHFRNTKDGSTYADATCKTIHDAHKTIRDSKRRGWELESSGIEATRAVGFCEYEQLAYQQI